MSWEFLLAINSSWRLFSLLLKKKIKKNKNKKKSPTRWELLATESYPKTLTEDCTS